jgi:hypothetical protein
MHDTGAHGPEDYLQNLYKKYKAKKHHRRQRRHHPHGPIQQDQDSQHDFFQTQNIGIKDIESAKNVVIGLQELYKDAHHDNDSHSDHSHSELIKEGKIKKEKLDQIIERTKKG